MYEPCDALAAPRFTGPHTYARLPHVKDFGRRGRGGVRDAMGPRGLLSLGHTVRPPEGIRSASGMIRTHHAVRRVQVFGALSSIDTETAPRRRATSRTP